MVPKVGGSTPLVYPLQRQSMNSKEKADKYDELVEKSGNGDDIIDIEGQFWIRMHPEMERWVESHTDMVEWMTEAVKFPPRSDCG